MRKRIAVYIFMVLLLSVVIKPTLVEATGTEVRYCRGCQTEIALENWIALGGE